MAEEHWCQALKLYANNCGFFGFPATLNLCSKCFRDLQLKDQQSSNAKIILNRSLTIAVSSVAEAASSVKASSFIQELSGYTTEVKALAVAEEARTENRCKTCRSRMGRMGFKCKCGVTFCDTHRYPELHGCEFDFKALGMEEIKKANPVIKAEKEVHTYIDHDDVS